MFDEYKKEFLKMKHPSEINEFNKKYKNYKSDKEMWAHFISLLEKHGMNDSFKNHSDPRKK
jgi:hypothetical protein